MQIKKSFFIGFIFIGAASYSGAAPFCQLETQGSLKNHIQGLRNTTLCALTQNMQVQGHRGMNGYPNNTLASFAAGYRAGAEVVELDLQITSDDRLLVAHDPTLDPKRCSLPGAKGLEEMTLRKMTFQQAQQVQCVEKEDGQGLRAPMPELREVFEEYRDLKTSRGTPAKLNIEIKYDRNRPEFFPTPEKYAEIIVANIQKGGWNKDRYIVQSFDHEILKYVKKIAPEIEVVPLVGNAKDAVAALEKLDVKMVTPSFTQLTPEIVSEIHRRGAKVIPWTVNTEEEMLKVISLGVDGIITDYPDRFIELQKKLCK